VVILQVKVADFSFFYVERDAPIAAYCNAPRSRAVAFELMNLPAGRPGNGVHIGGYNERRENITQRLTRSGRSSRLSSFSISRKSPLCVTLRIIIGGVYGYTVHTSRTFYKGFCRGLFCIFRQKDAFCRVFSGKERNLEAGLLRPLVRLMPRSSPPCLKTLQDGRDAGVAVFHFSALARKRARSSSMAAASAPGVMAAIILTRISKYLSELPI